MIVLLIGTAVLVYFMTQNAAHYDAEGEFQDGDEWLRENPDPLEPQWGLPRHTSIPMPRLVVVPPEWECSVPHWQLEEPDPLLERWDATPRESYAKLIQGIAPL